jgi:hypothetical protein
MKNQHDKSSPGRWVRNKQLGAHFNVTEMTIWRWKRDPKLNTPRSSVINGIEYNDLDQWDDWMRARVVNRAAPEAAA